jgi:peptidoglycan hydrolase FlgJ
MSQIQGVGATGAAAVDAARDAKLRRSAQQMEGVFIQQLFKAMRDTVPETDIGGGGFGEEIFTGMMDQHVADGAAQRWERGLGGAIYRQLRAQTEPVAPTQVNP